MARPPIARIAGTGAYLPERTVTNDDLSEIVETSDEWIRTRTGIQERRLAGDHESTAFMAATAAQRAMEQAGITAQEVDLILVSTLTPDHLMPSTAVEIQSLIGAENAWAYDFASACSGFVYGLQIAEGHLAAGQVQNILLICVEKMSSILDWEDRTTCVLFGDGAGAAVIQRSESKDGLLASVSGSDGRLTKALWRPAGGAERPFSAQVLEERAQYVKMEGKEVFKAAVRAMNDSIRGVLDKAGLSINDVNLLIPHQANQRILDAVAKAADFPVERVYSNVSRYGNMSSASIAVALHEALEESRLRKGDVALLVAFGAGFTWGANVLRV